MKDTGFARLRPRLEQAAKLHQRGEHARAIELYRALLAEAPELPPLLNLLGLALVQRGAVAEGLQHLNKAVHLAPNFADAWLNLAFARYESGDRDGAMAAYRTLLRLVPNHLTGLLSLASLSATGGLTETVTLLRKATEVAPDRALPWLRLRRAYLALGNSAGVAEVDRRLAQLNLRTAEEHVEAGNIELAERRPAEAMAHFRKAAELEPGLAAAVVGLGDALAQAEQYPAAAEAFRRATQLAPRRSSAWISLGTTLLAMKERDGAALAFEEALTREESPIARHLLKAARGNEDGGDVTPPEYIKWRYEQRALGFNKVIEQLGSVLPQTIGGLLTTLAPQGFRNALDLGCGTGICSEMLRPRCQRLVGLDLSHAMLTVARATMRYDDLIEREAVSYLAATTESYDLILTVDMLPHVGDLSPLIGQVRQHLLPEGLFVATVQQAEHGQPPAKGYALQLSGNYVHAPSYLESVAQANGLQPVHVADVVLPRDKDRPGRGTLAAFRAPPDR